MPTLRIRLVLCLVAALGLFPVAASSAPVAGATDLRQASALAVTWGRCPTSPPAHLALATARRTAPGPARATRAHRALRAWQRVVVECSAPVAMPTVDTTA